MRNPTLFSRIFNTPLMIQPAKLDAILAGIGGVAVIDLFGVLAHRGGFDAHSSYILGYDRIGQALAAALADNAVKSILLQLDSPGGEVAGAFELAEQIKQARATKPVNAVISNMATSAGYLLASAAGDIAISQTGVLLRHVDVSKMAENEGFKVTYVFAGGHKVDGNPYQPLPDPVKANFQAEIDKTYNLFIATVAENRGLTPGAVKAQEARVYSGSDAVHAGLADRIATPDEVLAGMRQGNFKASGDGKAAMADQQAIVAAGWDKAFKQATHPTPPGIAALAIGGHNESVGQPHQESQNPPTMPQGQTEAAAGWDKAFKQVANQQQ